MINAAMPDRTFNKQAVVESYAWSTGIAPDKSYKVIRCNPASNGIRNIDTSAALIDAFGNADTTYHFPGGMITVGSVRKMVELRRAIAEGTAMPADIAAFEATSAERQKTMDGAVGQIAQAMIDNRDKKLLMVGMFATLFKVAETLQSMGYGGKDFHAENSLMVGGGLKGAVLPPDYRERILAAFNIAPKRVYHFYSMQELNTHMPRCEEGQYHVPPWLMVLPLDQPGEKLVGAFKGEVEGRAAFFDLSHDGRWCGVITGDRIKIRYGKCACGHEGPTVGPDIVRYSELEGGDKISCAGTIDAYVRGAA
jgi:hypothetical protein